MTNYVKDLYARVSKKVRLELEAKRFINYGDTLEKYVEVVNHGRKVLGDKRYTKYAKRFISRIKVAKKYVDRLLDSEESNFFKNAEVVDSKLEMAHKKILEYYKEWQTMSSGLVYSAAKKDVGAVITNSLNSIPRFRLTLKKIVEMVKSGEA